AGRASWASSSVCPGFIVSSALSAALVSRGGRGAHTETRSIGLTRSRGERGGLVLRRSSRCGDVAASSVIWGYGCWLRASQRPRGGACLARPVFRRDELRSHRKKPHSS